jgi:small subunit ribosomal protein S21
VKGGGGGLAVSIPRSRVLYVEDWSRMCAAFLCGLKRGEARLVEVQVRDNNVDQALRALKKKMQREGLYREMRMRRHYEKPSERRAREQAEAVRRYRKLQRKRRERDEL